MKKLMLICLMFLGLSQNNQGSDSAMTTLSKSIEKTNTLLSTIVSNFTPTLSMIPTWMPSPLATIFSGIGTGWSVAKGVHSEVGIFISIILMIRSIHKNYKSILQEDPDDMIQQKVDKKPEQVEKLAGPSDEEILRRASYQY